MQILSQPNKIKLKSGSNTIANAPANRSTNLGTPTKLKDMEVNYSGVVKLTFQWKYTLVSQPGECHVYVNGVFYLMAQRATTSYGVFNSKTFDIPVKAGDNIQIYCYNEGATGSGTWEIQNATLQINNMVFATVVLD